MSALGKLLFAAGAAWLYGWAREQRAIHVAACMRIVELQRLLAWERRQADNADARAAALLEQLKTERIHANGLGAVAREALSREVDQAERVARLVASERALREEVECLQEMVAPSGPPIDQELLEAARAVVEQRFCGRCGGDRLEDGRASAAPLKRLQEAVRRAGLVAAERAKLGEESVGQDLAELLTLAADEAADVIDTIARHERRSPAAVLREIAGETEERPACAELLAAVEEARVALQEAGESFMVMRLSETQASLACSESMADALNALNRAGQPRARSPVEVRADEIEAWSRKEERTALDVDDVMRWAREHHEAHRRTGKATELLEAQAMLLVAQRMLAREAAR